MDDAITTAIASALATKATEVAAGAGRSVWTMLMRLIRAKLAQTGEASTTLQPALDHPDDPSTVGALAEALAQASIEDPDFAAQLRALWDRASGELVASDDGTLNQISGTVHGNVVQARDVTIHGNAW